MESKKIELSELQDLYRNSSQKVRKITLKAEDAEKHYGRYVNFVLRYAQSGSFLDIGCGSGWSSYLFSQKNMDVRGMDLHESGYEAPESETLKFEKGDAQNLKFSDEMFDNVSTNECLEHVPDPELALREMIRVLKPGGHLFIVGPNLLSLGMSIKALFRYVWMQRPITRVLFRDKDLPYHPLGNTLPEIITYLFKNIFRILGKLMSSKPSFIMRVPDLRPPFHADSDSCYLLNPIDLEKFVANHTNLKIVQSGAIGRPSSLKLVAAGTWICIQKIK